MLFIWSPDQVDQPDQWYQSSRFDNKHDFYRITFTGSRIFPVWTLLSTFTMTAFNALLTEMKTTVAAL